MQPAHVVVEILVLHNVQPVFDFNAAACARRDLPEVYKDPADFYFAPDQLTLQHWPEARNDCERPASFTIRNVVERHVLAAKNADKLNLSCGRKHELPALAPRFADPARVGLKVLQAFHKHYYSLWKRKVLTRLRAWSYYDHIPNVVT